jgi:hypothetical protein
VLSCAARLNSIFSYFLLVLIRLPECLKPREVIRRTTAGNPHAKVY